MQFKHQSKFLLVGLICFYLSGCKSKPKASLQAEYASPNIVLLFVDDWGWADVGFRNSKFLTPNIDQLKSDGVEFTRAYIPTPTCSPSRASLLTGIEAARLEMYRHIVHTNKDGTNDEKYGEWPKDPANRLSINWLELERETYAEKLKEFDYYNLFIGKWHLGHEPYHPIEQGFDEQFGTSNWGHPKGYYAPYFKKSDVLKGAPEGKYLTDTLTDKAVDFIAKYERDKPFMISLWYYNVHGPHKGRQDWVNYYKEQGLEKKDAHYAAMVTTMDESVGRVRKALLEKGIADNTVVLLISDQGGAFSNAPLSGGKKGGNTLGEGGARVPFIIYDPRSDNSNQEIVTPIQTIDVFPTLVELASGKPYSSESINGKSLVPLLTDQPFVERDLFFFRSYEDQSSAIMNGDWKLIKYLSGKYQLFNITEDISESTDLIDMEVERVAQMKERLAKWEMDAIKPQ